MAKRFLVDLDLHNNELQNAVIENSSADPVGAVTGQVFYDTDDNRIKFYNGTQFKKLNSEDDTGANTLNALTDTNVTGLAAGDVLIYDGVDSFDNKVLNGDVTIASTGAVTIENDAVTFAKINPSTYSSDLSASATATELVRADAAKAYVDAAVASADAFVIKGNLDASTNPNYPAANAGESYIISVGGKIGGASGEVVEVGDIAVCTADSTATGDEATVGTSWVVIQSNTDAAGINTVLGITAGDQDLGIFTGSTITDNGSVIDALQELETAVETNSTNSTGKYIETIGNSVLTTFTINHALNDQEVIVQVRDASSNDVVECDIVLTDANNVQLTFATAPATNDIKVVVIG